MLGRTERQHVKAGATTTSRQCVIGVFVPTERQHVKAGATTTSKRAWHVRAVHVLLWMCKAHSKPRSDGETSQESLVKALEYCRTDQGTAVEIEYSLPVASRCRLQ